MTRAIAAFAFLLAACAAGPAAPTEPAPAPPASNWRAVDPENLILIDVPTGTFAIELYPDSAPAHAAQIRAAVRAGFYDGEYFYRVIEGHVAQGGREFDQALEGWPTLPFEAERAVNRDGFVTHGNADPFAPEVGHRHGFAVGREGEQEWLLNCPGTLGMARNDPPGSGSTEIFIPLQPRRYLDRNYTIFGRVIDGLQHVHRLPRVDPSTEEETEALFGDDPELAHQIRQWRRSKLAENVILSARIAADLPEEERPAFEVLMVESEEWDSRKAARRDFSAIPAFISPPPQILEICSLPVPVRRAE
ncbi:peptidylprolyl isomerase [Hyphomonas sp.]|uniref:peptidylprolyl isomerase n=1 Tax=Hyphomonas sp. TaxID=87 RepID=UPI00391A2E9C